MNKGKALRNILSWLLIVEALNRNLGNLINEVSDEHV